MLFLSLSAVKFCIDSCLIVSCIAVVCSLVSLVFGSLSALLSFLFYEFLLFLYYVVLSSIVPILFSDSRSLFVAVSYYMSCIILSLFVMIFFVSLRLFAFSFLLCCISFSSL